MPRKHASGAQKRKSAKARALASGNLMPSAPTLLEISSLTGVAREMGKIYRAMRLNRMSREEYLVSTRGLSSLTQTLSAVEVERQREVDEALVRAVELAEAGRDLAVIPSMTTFTAPLHGELMPRDEQETSE